jgi:hypothetical protein
VTTEPRPEWPSFVRDFVFPFLHSEPLRPVLIAMLGHVALAWALVILRVADGFYPENLASLFVCVALSGAPIFEELRIERRPRALTATVLVSWVMGFAVAGAMRWTGVM